MPFCLHTGMPRIVVGSRKLQKGNRSVLVTVPKVWLENTGLKPGDSIEAEITEEGLLLRPKKEG
ncbi:hypothetical protein DRP04_03715 [Archaeoglobales archaeon]|nr:MAG: hypothetical protein DRP04_03715 [Archaeoglobales archaeon]